MFLKKQAILVFMSLSFLAGLLGACALSFVVKPSSHIEWDTDEKPEDNEHDLEQDISDIVEHVPNWL